MIWSGSRANLKPPSGPRWLVTSPPRRRSDRIAPRNLAGRSCSWARCSALTETSLAAKVSSARIAYSALAGICIPPFCPTAAEHLERLLGWTSCSPSMTRRLYLCVGHRDDLADVPAGGPARRRRRRPVAREGPRRPDADRRRRADGADLSRLRRALHHERLPGAGRSRSTPTACTWVKTTSACRAVANCLGHDAIVGLSTHSADEFDDALNQTATYFSAGPIVATPTKPGRAGTGVDYARRQPSAQRPPGLRHRRRQRRQRRVHSWPRGFVTSSSCARSPRRLTPRRRRGGSATRSTRRSQRCRSSQPNNVATIRGSARSW